MDEVTVVKGNLIIPVGLVVPFFILSAITQKVGNSIGIRDVCSVLCLAV